jgi:uncharacterized protein YhfF
MDRVVEMYWRAYCDTLPNDHEEPRLFEVFGFGDTPEMADDLGGLVVASIKTATCSLLWEYETTGESMPSVGDFSVVLSGEGKPLCIIETTEVQIRPYDEVDEQFAFDEGEGDRSLAYWRSAHWGFFAPYCEEMGKSLDEKMPLVCERFRVVKR